jgi:hypothetical protein
MDSIIVPKDLTGDIEFYLPFPLGSSGFERVIFFFRILLKHLQLMRTDN